MADIASALIGEAGSLLGTGFQALYNDHATKQQYKYNRKLMLEQNDLNIANWQRQNEYNSPSKQVARMKAAGLNPSLFYGASANALGSDVSPVGSQSVGQAHPVTTDFGQSTLQSSLMDAQREVMESQAAKNFADANQTNELTPWVSKEIQSRLSLNDQNAKLLNENVEKVRNESELLKWQSNVTKSESEILSAVKDSKISASLAEYNLTEKQSEIIQKHFAELYSAQIKLALAQCYASYVTSDAARTNAQVNVKSQQLDAIIRHGELAVKRYQTSLNKAMTDAGIHNLELQNQWRDELNSSGPFGRAVHDILSIPVNALGGFFH